jgi:hypothetical protein
LTPTDAPSADPPKRPRPLYGIVAGVGVLLSAVLLVRGLSFAVQTLLPARLVSTRTGFLKRTRDLLGQLPAIAQARSPTGLAIGSSTVMFNLSPDVLDDRLHEHGRELSTFNLGLMAVVPDHLLLLARALRAEYMRTGHRSAVTIIEYQPASMTGRFQDKRIDLLKLAQLMNADEVFALARKNRAQASEIATIKLFGGLGTPELSDLVSAWLSNLSRPMPTIASADPNTAEALAEERLDQQLRAVYGGEVPGWDARRRGEFRRLFPETEAAYGQLLEVMTSDAKMKESLADFVNMGDVVELRFDEQQLAAFILAVRELQRFSDRVFLLTMPRNERWLQLSAAGARRSRDALERIRRETNVALIDFAEASDFGAGEFCDLIHLTEAGKQRFSLQLADRLAPLLSASDR